jgi:diguanylate cyclase (GGDEF)-like protein/PAS domain S-box-containing protein
MIMLYGVSTVLEKMSATERRLQMIATLHALVSDNSRDAIILADLSGHRSYGSAAAESIEGWKPEQLLTEEGMELVHPDDRSKAQLIVNQLNSGTDSAMIECRIRKQDGQYIWVEASLRIVRDPETGARAKVLNIVRDISERKRAEQQLQEAYNAVEALAVTDGLTGLANRRRLDQYLTSEWRRSMREHKPLSLLMIDADHFKLYNDTYGHARGDSGLRQIAEAAQDVVSRPGDLVARFGGEEFAVVLPNTENDGAMLVANEICEALRARRLPHSGNSYGIMTISVGCATMVPSFGQHAVNLIELADQALYKAKRSGRNRACNSSDCDDETLKQPVAIAASKSA